jgi:hypothetical protein
MKNLLLSQIEGLFPISKILLVYYGGSIAYGLQDGESDEDITVVLDNFSGNIHLNLDKVDLFVFSRERFIQRQHFDESITSYHRASADNLMSIDSNLIYLDTSFIDELESIKYCDSKEFMLKHLTAQIDYGKMRFEISQNLKSHYHIFRMRGMVDNFDKTGHYNLTVPEPWYSKMMDYKLNWDNEIGQSYLTELEAELQYLIEYRDRMMNDELG